MKVCASICSLCSYSWLLVEISEYQSKNDCALSLVGVLLWDLGRSAGVDTFINHEIRSLFFLKLI